MYFYLGETMLRYSEIPRELSADSLRFSEKYSKMSDQDQYYNLRDESPQSDNNKEAIFTTPIPADVSSNKTSDKLEIKLSNSAKKLKAKKKSICSMNAQDLFPQLGGSNSNGSCSSGGLSVPINNLKSHSLPPNSSLTDLDTTITSALRIPPEELASQITLLDMPIFKNIQPDELTSCAWTKKNKYVVTPNIVAFTRRFNHTSFWTIEEILNCPTQKERGEMITHFIKVGKRLLDLSNLHSLFAITSALKSASIHRLTKSWSYLSKKDKQSLEKLSDIFKEDNNWSNLREIIDSLKCPCIPYLGVFLTDLVYVDLAHPNKGFGLEPEQRQLKMNNILRVIAIYQNSDYGHLVKNSKIQNYLQSIRYIEELQNMFQEEQYKKSLKLEPQASASNSNAKESTIPCNHSLTNLESNLAALNVSPAKSNSMRLNANQTPNVKFSLGHRKTQSLGSNIFHKLNPPSVNIQRNESFHQSRNLIDDSVLEDVVVVAEPTSLQMHLQTDAMSSGSSEGWDADLISNSSGANALDSPNESVSFQGSLRRKTVLKEGKKPTVASWQRYWLELWSNSLVYFAPKSFKGTERSDYKREPCKICSLDGWTVELTENSSQTNTFQLKNQTLGNIYKFRCSSHDLTILWLKKLKEATGHVQKPLPANLMSFE